MPTPRPWRQRAVSLILPILFAIAVLVVPQQAVGTVASAPAFTPSQSNSTSTPL
jgi:hypothetical protein